MLHDAGILQICSVETREASGAMAKEQLVEHSEHYYGERTVGYGRQYAAKGVSEQIDMLAEIWQDRTVRIGMVAVTECGEQYRIDNVQHKLDEDGLRVSWLTLRRLEDLYDIAADT